MRQVLVMAVFMLATAVWTIAQQGTSSGQSTSSSSQTPTAGGQGQSSASGSASRGTSQTPDSSQTQGSSQSGAGTQSQSSQTPGAGQSSTPGTAGQGSAQTPGSSQTPGSTQPPDSATPGSSQSGAGTPTQAGNATITEGCLGGTSPNFTITDTAGTTYKLNIPAGADASPLASHIGESVQVMGHVNKGAGAGSPSTIDATRIGRGTGNCQAGSSKQTPR